MPGPGDLTERQRAPIIGRDAGLAQVRALVDPVPEASQVLLVTGEAGMGKTALLADAADRARRAGTRVLSVTGRESESRLAFAGLHQLLRPVLSRTTDLPGRQAEALLGALGLAPAPGAPDPLLTGVAVLTLLSDLSERSPVLVVADDVHWLDLSSLDALAFVGSRLDADRIVLLVGARGQAPPIGFDRGFPELHLGQLSAADAGLLLDAQPRPPHGWARTQVLAQAAGNPMALIELAKVVADDPAASRRWAAEPLPPGDRLTAVLASRFAALPEPARAALLLAAVADGPDLSAAASWGSAPDAPSLAPAEELGLVKVDRTGLRFSHPLVRSAVYHSAPFAQRAAAHRQLAEALYDQPDRRAWHLAAAALQPDEHVASLLEATAAQAQQRGGAAAAALAMERAAELSPDRPDQARRLVAAASAAVSTGNADWVTDLATRALAVTADPRLRLTARHRAGWALAYSGQRGAALPALLSVAEEAASDQPTLAWDALADAAIIAYHSGTSASCQAVRRVAGVLEDPGLSAAGHGPRADVGPQRAWIRACTDPFGSRSELVTYLRSPVEEPALWRVGSAAWLLDESDLAITLLQDAMQRLRAPGTQGTSGPGLTALGWAYIDTGRWDEAQEAAAEAADLAEANRMDLVAASAELIAATVLAMRADSGAARRHADRALANPDLAETGLIAARARRALGIAALADGSHLLAFTQLRQLFSEEGVPVHNIFSYLGVADIATAAVRADRRLEGQDVVERALSQLDGTASPRLEQLIARARGVLAGPDEAEAHFAKALADPAGDQWPFERAQLRLDHAEWLRRHRRINDAKPVLTDALATFRRLGARSWAQRAEAELRASGVAVADAPGEGDVLGGLTPQQRLIVRLASDGLTNREIGDRLFLSPRTVSSHLYRSFPKLGVADRHQLRDVIARAAAPAPADDSTGSLVGPQAAGQERNERRDRVVCAAGPPAHAGRGPGCRAPASTGVTVGGDMRIVGQTGPVPRAQLLRAAAFLLLEAVADDPPGDPDAAALAALVTEMAGLVGEAKGFAPPSAEPAWPGEVLTQGETRVLRYLPTHMGAPEIAAELFLSANTVKTHLRHLYQKLGAHTRREAVQRARAIGLLTASPTGLRPNVDHDHGYF
jgi:DNA-binding NarL/FixJ family response regulator